VKERHFYIGFFLLFVCFFAGTSRARDVDLIFVNGNVYTLDERQPHAEVVTAKRDRIAFVGNLENTLRDDSHRRRDRLRIKSRRD
jgi:hypothetical protein